MSRRGQRQSSQQLLSTAAVAIILFIGALYTLFGEQLRSPTLSSQQPQQQQAQAAIGQTGLPTIAWAELPDEAHTTIELIDRGGPFPFRKDGTTFQNREGLLPKQPNGYYREYTVITPGEDDRGARRIVAGRNGELFYTADHYASFREVIR
ncbi:MAG: hypothetical protein OHK0050_13620 [Roseiflexaceae bacterium]